MEVFEEEFRKLLESTEHVSYQLEKKDAFNWVIRIKPADQSLVEKIGEEMRKLHEKGNAIREYNHEEIRFLADEEIMHRIDRVVHQRFWGQGFDRGALRTENVSGSEIRTVRRAEYQFSNQMKIEITFS